MEGTPEVNNPAVATEVSRRRITENEVCINALITFSSQFWVTYVLQKQQLWHCWLG